VNYPPQVDGGTVKRSFEKLLLIHHIAPMSKKPLRTSMPQVTVFVDGLRAAFGTVESGLTGFAAVGRRHGRPRRPKKASPTLN
jgi:hypothetical protein